MDPISQGVFGAALPTATARNKSLLPAVLLGWLAGMAPDIDIFIRSKTDPLLFLEYHRQFTHSLIFIPFGALLCALLFHAFFRKNQDFGTSYRYCLLGYATHGLLDACTTYGTQLFWPFSNVRVSWNSVSIVDPLITLPMLTLVALAVWRKKRLFAQIALAYAILYIGLGVVQRNRAIDTGQALALSRGHTPVNLSAKPSLGNIVLWKIIYETDGRYYVDAVHILKTSEIITGHSILKLDLARDFPWLDPASKQAADVERFRWFSQGYVAKSPVHNDLIVDVRYSMIPNEIHSLWGIRLNQKGQDQHVRYETFRDKSANARSRFWQLLFQAHD